VVTIAYGLYLSLSSFVAAVETTVDTAITMVADVVVDAIIAKIHNSKRTRYRLIAYNEFFLSILNLHTCKAIRP